MKASISLAVAVLIGAIVLMGPVVPPVTAQEQDAGGAAAATLLSEAELDQLTAPIALYSDPLLGAVLVAATYPLEVVEATRWVDDPANAALSGDQLTNALQQHSWDSSVKSLVQFPDVLRMMNADLQWTERLGDAFLAQQSDVMASVQRLRQRASAARSLQSTPQQTVASEGGEISIEPANPDVIYAPYYDPTAVYGLWPWPDYPPFVFAPPPGVYFGAGIVFFGSGIPIVAPWWNTWYVWDWPHHIVAVVPRHGPAGPRRPWVHEPSHRRGVPYGDPGVASRYLGAAAAARQGFRGYPAPEAGAEVPSRPAVPGAPRTQAPRPVPVPAPESRPPATAPRYAPPPAHYAPPARPGPPVFESFGRGGAVRGEAERGSSSRSAPVRSAPPPPPPTRGRPRS